jgi:putative DNA methylase
MRTEGATRMLASGTNALASSIALVCRPRSETAALATRKELLTALKAELPGALRHLQQGSIAPVDLAQAAIGPGMAVFSRYAKVVEADGSAMTVRTALGLINQVLDETLAEQEADFDADTRWAVAWFEQHGVNPGPFGVAETLSKAKNTALNGLVAAGIVESKAGKVRLFERSEVQDVWDPGADKRLTVWEVTQHLIRALDSGGENKAAELLRRIGGLGEPARELAYRLYVICERKKWAKEALAYNSLVVAWPDIARLASSTATSAPAQQELL